MPMCGEGVFWCWAYDTGSEWYTWTSSIDMPPSAVMAKTSLAQYMEFQDFGAARVGLVSIRHRLPDGSDETVPFDLGGNVTLAVFDPTMTSVTFGVMAFGSQAYAVLDLGWWE